MRPAVGLAARSGCRAGSFAADRTPGDFAQVAVAAVSAAALLVEVRLAALVEADLACPAADRSLAATVCRQVAPRARPDSVQAAARWEYWAAAGSDSRQPRLVDWD